MTRRKLLVTGTAGGMDRACAAVRQDARPGAGRRERGGRRGQDRPPEAPIASVQAREGAVQVPTTVAFVDALPLSQLGKPDKKALRLCCA